MNPNKQRSLNSTKVNKQASPRANMQARNTWKYGDLVEAAMPILEPLRAWVKDVRVARKGDAGRVVGMYDGLIEILFFRTGRRMVCFPGEVTRVD